MSIITCLIASGISDPLCTYRLNVYEFEYVVESSSVFGGDLFCGIALNGKTDVYLWYLDCFVGFVVSFPYPNVYL